MGEIADGYLADLAEAKGLSARVTDAVISATQEFCRCGGKGPNDSGVCDACKVYHAVNAFLAKQEKQPTHTGVKP